MNEQSFKKKNRKDECSGCPKKVACALADSICHLVTPCSVCEIRDNCTVLCNQMNSYLSRGSQRVATSTSFNLSPRTEDIYSYVSEENKKPSSIHYADIEFRAADLPWEILSERDSSIVKDHFLLGKSYETIAKEQGLTVNRVYRIVHGEKNRQGALKKLKEYSLYRTLYEKFGKFISRSHKEILVQKYFLFKSSKEMKKVDETDRQMYYRINKAKNVLLKFIEVE